MKKKIVSCLLAASMVAGMFAGCGDSKEEANNQEQETVSGDETTGDETTGDETTGDETTGDETPETFIKDTEISMFVDFTWLPYDEWGTEPVSQEITKNTGISVDVTRSTGEDNLPLLIAGGDLPDVVYAANGDRILPLQDPDVCWTLDELMEMYPDVELNISDDERAFNEGLSPDGKLYCVRNCMLPADYEGDHLAGGGNYYLSYRKDILNELGLKEPTNMDEFEELLMKVKEAYPDMLPLCWRDGYDGFFANMMGHGTWWGLGYKDDADKESGEMALWIENEGMKDVYATINRFARNGLINAETTTYDMDQTYELMKSGKGFACISSADAAQVFQNSADEAGETDVQWGLMTEPFTTYQSYWGLSGWAGFFITKNCKDPETALRFYSYMRSEEGRRLTAWGIEGKDWEWDEDGNYTRTEEYNQFLADGGFNFERGMGVWLIGDQGEEAKAVDLKHARETGGLALDNMLAQLNYAEGITVHQELTFMSPKAGTDLANKSTALYDAIGSLEAKVVFAESEAEFETAWTEMIDQANTYGMQELNEYATQAVAEYRANN